MRKLRETGGEGGRREYREGEKEKDRERKGEI